MKDFFREFWLWILIPFLLVAGGLVFLLVTSSGSDGASPFVYNVF